MSIELTHCVPILPLVADKLFECIDHFVGFPLRGLILSSVLQQLKTLNQRRMFVWNLLGNLYLHSGSFRTHSLATHLAYCWAVLLFRQNHKYSWTETLYQHHHISSRFCFFFCQIVSDINIHTNSSTCVFKQRKKHILSQLFQPDHHWWFTSLPCFSKYSRQQNRSNLEKLPTHLIMELLMIH